MNTQSTYNLFGTKTKLIDEIMSLTWGKAARICCRKFQLFLLKINNNILSRVTSVKKGVDIKNPSETKSSAYFSGK